MAGLLAAVPFALLVAHFSFVCDDAYIVFRYARNLAGGLGLRYNPGVEPPVEGYTQLGWVLWMTPVELFGWDPAFWSRATSIACGAVLLVAIASVARRRFGPGLLPATAATLFFAVLPPVSVWTTGGLETMAFTLAVFGVFERLLGDPERPRPGQAAVCGLLACLLRADGVWWVLAVLAAASDETLRGRSRAALHASLKGIFGCAVAVLFCFALLEAFRIGYHGDWVPNTARVKVGFSALALQRGAFYVISSWLTVPAMLVLPLHALWLDLRRTVPLARPCLVVVAATFIYAVLVGGDFMAMGRLLVPAAPFLALLAGGVAERLAGHARPVRAALHGAALLVLTVPASFDLHLAPLRLREAFHFRWSSERHKSEYATWEGMKLRVEQWELLGRALAAHTAPGESLVHGTIGAVGYHSGLFVYDRFGLVTREVLEARIPPERRSTPGHDRQVHLMFFERFEPTYVGASVVAGALEPGVWPAPEDSPGHTVEVVPLSTADGFPPDRALLLQRPPRDP